MARPSFSSVWNNFRYIYGNGSVVSVGDKIGGKVEQNFDLGVTSPQLGFTNACAVRMSYALNHSGVTIERGPWSTVSGEQGKQYIFRVRDMLKFLRHKFGKPDIAIQNPDMKELAGEKGILIFTVTGWSDATGHATVWNGNACGDRCYFSKASEVSLWRLK